MELQELTSDTGINFQSLYDRYGTPVRRYLLSKTGAPEVAEDLCQDVFLALWRSRTRLSQVRSPKSWIFRIARNRGIDYYRFRNRERSVRFGDGVSDELEDRDSTNEVFQIDRGEIVEGRRSLSEDKRKLLDLIYYFRLTYEEAAGVVGVPIGTIKRRLHDIRIRLKQLSDGRHARNPTVTTPVQRDMSGTDRVRVASVPYVSDLMMDIYYPPDFRLETLLPVVVFVMGYSNERFERMNGIRLKDMAQYRSWGRLVAASGMVAVSYETDSPFQDIHTLLNCIMQRGNMLGMDCSRLGLFACSDNVTTALPALTDTGQPYAQCIRCGAIYYPVFCSEDTSLERLYHEGRVDFRKDVPLQFVEIGKEYPTRIPSAKSFARNILSSGAMVEHVLHADGVHGFDMFSSHERTREIVDQTLAFLKRNLI